ncbi:MAG: YihY/virulence factor BrkB family protein [Silvanigrellaceae bacterium]
MAIAHPRHWQRLLQRKLAEQTRLNWRWLFVRVFNDATARAKRFDIASDSRALSFTFILSLVPLLAIAFTFFKLFGGLNYFLENTLKPLLEKSFPINVAEQLKSFIDGFVGNLQTGTLGVVSFVTLLATVIVLMMNIEQSFNRIFEARDRRSIMKRIGSYWIMLSATPLIIVLSSAKSSELLLAFKSSKGILNQFGVVDFLRFAVGHLVQVVGFGSLFIVLPANKPRLISAFWGALVTHLVFQLLATINVHYATFVFSNSTNLRLYGSLPLLVLVFLIWLRLVWLGILYGACVCVSIDRYLDTVKSSENKKPWQVPHDTILNCIRTLEHYIESFNQQRRPLSHADVAALLEISIDELEQHQERLQRKGLIIPIRFEERDCFAATVSALNCHTQPRQLVADLLEIPPNQLKTASFSESNPQDLVQQARTILASLGS